MVSANFSLVVWPHVDLQKKKTRRIVQFIIISVFRLWTFSCFVNLVTYHANLHLTVENMNIAVSETNMYQSMV